MGNLHYNRSAQWPTVAGISPNMACLACDLRKKKKKENTLFAAGRLGLGCIVTGNNTYASFED